MGKNSVCFCGSGMKLKDCHPDIDPRSRGARILKLYNKIDKAIEEHYKSTGLKYPCKGGCAECCYDYFPISEIEFDLILHELQKWDFDDLIDLVKKTKFCWEKMREIEPDYLSSLENEDDGEDIVSFIIKNYMNTFGGEEFPCLFLNPETKLCKIYKVRPLICRRHGVSYNHVKREKDSPSLNGLLKSFNYNEDFDICTIIGSNKEARKWQYNVSKFYKELKTLTYIENSRYPHTVGLRTYPMIYYLYMRFYLKRVGLNIIDHKEKFELEEIEYIEKMLKEA